MNKSKIEWTERTWNPVTGCSKISAGCQNCYAERMSKRLAGRAGYPADEPFRVTLHPDRLDQPLRWSKPSKIFVCSMSDLFHEDVPDEFITQVFAFMALAPQHTFLVLTKRPKRMSEYISASGRYDAIIEQLNKGDVWDLPLRTVKRLAINAPREDKWPLPNVWLGVTAENQEQAEKRIPILLQIPAAVRWVSVEPMLGAVELRKINLGPNGHGLSFTLDSLNRWAHGFDEKTGRHKVSRNDEFPGKLDWIVCGGESGPGARPMHPEWARSLRDQCQAAGVPYFFKQWGEWLPQKEWLEQEDSPDTERKWVRVDGRRMYRVGKKLAGRLLDGVEWSEFPKTL